MGSFCQELDQCLVEPNSLGIGNMVDNLLLIVFVCHTIKSNLGVGKTVIRVSTPLARVEEVVIIGLG